MVIYGINFFAGLLTAVSPCVLPALPLIVGSAVQEHRFAPLALSLGMILSFTLLGILGASTADLGMFNPDVIRTAFAVMMVVFGLLLISSRGQIWFQTLLQPLSSRFFGRVGGLRFPGLAGQFVLGLTLGGVWAPCVGPTLGAAITLAAQAGGVFPASLRMLAFSVGSVVPLLFIAYGSKTIFAANRSNLLRLGTSGKTIMGIICLLTGGALLTGLDKIAESFLLEMMPQSWIDLISKL